MKTISRTICRMMLAAASVAALQNSLASAGHRAGRQRNGARRSSPVFRQSHHPTGVAAGNDVDQSNEPHARHVPLHRAGDELWIYYTNIGDAPERILRCKLQLARDWRNWKTSPHAELLLPELDYEGANLPVTKSRSGESAARENAMRDPANFTDLDGLVYLLYSVASESGITIAEIVNKQ